MSVASTRPTVSKELKGLKFEKQNQGLLRLPPSTTVQRRPLNHAPIASPYAGADVAKIVYISRKTPMMSAVKRVKKLLLHIERRATQSVDQAKDKNAKQKVAKVGEAVFVRASGRAMEKALRIAEWFRSKEQELECTVELRTSSVQAVDDLVEIEEADATMADEEDGVEHPEAAVEKSNDSSDVPPQGVAQQKPEIEAVEKEESSQVQVNTTEKKTRRAKRKRKAYDEDDLPEARIRWVKTIEVAISLTA